MNTEVYTAVGAATIAMALLAGSGHVLAEEKQASGQGAKHLQEQRSSSGIADECGVLDSVIKLPNPSTGGGMPLAEALAKRRTCRAFADRPLSIEQVSQLCWAAQGITQTQKGLRTAPSAGALYPLTVYVLDRKGVFEYEPKPHVLRRLASEDVRRKPENGPLSQASVRSAPVCLVVVMDVSRLTPRFKGHEERYSLLEAGHVAQNILLQATALGLAGTPVGGADESKVRVGMNLPDRLRPVYLLPVGYPADK